MTEKILNRVPVKVGGCTIGGDEIVIQSMTNTDTADVQKTVQQIYQLWQTGSQLVRITVDKEAAAAAVPEIIDRLAAAGCNVPIIGDFHYNGHTLLSKYPKCAEKLAKYRINPGNVGFGKKKDTQFAQIIEIAKKYNKPVRIGANWGSLDQKLLAKMMDQNNLLDVPLAASAVMEQALIVSALDSAKQAIELGLSADKIIISCKVSSVQALVNIYQTLASRCSFPLHLGLTEAGMGSKGIVASVAALSILLQQGIGDTIRISLTPKPGQSRNKEVIVAQQLLQTMGLKSFTPMVVACPGCGRTTSTIFQELAEKTTQFIRLKMPQWRLKYPGVENMSVAVMGCIVNGPGESKHADIGISLPGTGEAPAAPVFIKGKKTQTLRGENITDEFLTIMSDFVESNYG